MLFVPFQIMNIWPPYNMLLWKPWIHYVGAIFSSLCQKIKYVIDGKVVTIFMEESLLFTRSPSVLYIEANDETVESLF